MNQYYIENKNSGETITQFPKYDKVDGYYGYIVLIKNNCVLFFYATDEGTIQFDDISDDYDIFYK